MNRAIVVIGLIACSKPDPAPQPTTGSAVTAQIAITDVAVIPIEGGERVLEHQTVTIDGDRITAIGPAATMKVVAKTQIDGK